MPETIDCTVVPKVGKTKRCTVQDIGTHADQIVIRVTSFTAYEYADLYFDRAEFLSLLHAIEAP